MLEGIKTIPAPAEVRASLIRRSASQKIGRPTRKSRPFLLAAAVVAIIIAATLLLFARRNRLAGGDLSEPLRREQIVESVYGIGTVMANRSYQVKVGVANTIEDIYVQEGDSVFKGSRLLRLGGVVIRAPFPGTVTSLPHKTGENVFPGVPILGIVDLSDRYVVVSLEQRAAMRTRRGQRARLSFETMRGESYDGTVAASYSNEGNFLVRIDSPGLPPQILPGMTADVAIGVGENRRAIAIPVAAIAEGNVRVRRGSAAPFVAAIKTGVVDGARAEVLSGDVREGDRLVVPRKASP
ncbi:MAG: efflux RND transporter periplasmic adaptor subunit [Elusimicrobia bacterium]|nr:efflux RND transporter periplasmic adaptor subunit [Elusimicrobiota bacterium]